MGVGGCWVWRQVGGRTEGGVRRECEPGVGRGGLEGGRKKPRQALEARRLRHAERTVLPAVAQSKKGGGGWRVWREWGLSLGVAFVARW